MDLRKQKEIEHYEEKAEEQLKSVSRKKKVSDFEGFDPGDLNSFSFCYKWLEKNCRNKKVLDYGCGNGIHSLFIAKTNPEKLTGIDLSEKSLEIAEERLKKKGLKEKAEFLKMDCEKMDFPDQYFDVVFDGGTFSSLDLSAAYAEISRVLKPDGYLIGIETFGHNPLTNLKRRLNRMTGKRTEWADKHILRDKDLEEAKNYFSSVETKFFHLTSWFAFPFINLPLGKPFLKILEAVDEVLLKIPFLRKYSFKLVFIMSKPKQNA